MIFVVYMGGAAGDMVASVIDHRNSKFNSLQQRMEMSLDRQRFKKPHTFESDAAKDEYVQQMSAIYCEDCNDSAFIIEHDDLKLNNISFSSSIKQYIGLAIFSISILSIILSWAIFFADNFQLKTNQLFHFLINTFGWLYLLTTLSMVFVAIYLAHLLK